MTTKTEQDIRTFIAENFLFTDDSSALSATESLIEADIINSTGVLEVVLFLEDHFKIKVEDDEVVPDNLDSIKSMVAYVDGKLADVAIQKSA